MEGRGDRIEDRSETSTDALLDSLAHPVRRRVLRTLAAHESERVPVRALAEEVATGGGAPDRTRDELELELRHWHLPKLAGANVLAFDDEGRAVAYRPNELAEKILAVVDER